MVQEKKEKLTYTVPEAAEMLNVSASLLYRELKNGTCEIPFIRIGNRIVIGRKALTDYVDNFE